MAIISFRLTEKFRMGRALLVLSSLSLSFLAILYCKEKFYHVGQFFEYAIQILTPLFLLLTIYYPDKVFSKKFSIGIKLAIASTFIAHGMYAIGYYPRLGVFVDMTINSIGVSESIAHLILKIAGILDIVAAVSLFLNRYSQVFILYCVVWGLLTAIARSWANINPDPLNWSLFHQYLPQTLYRLRMAFCHLCHW